MFEHRYDGSRIGSSHTLEYVALGGTVQLFCQCVPRDGAVGDFTVNRGLPALQNGRSEWWVYRLSGDEVVDADRTLVGNKQVTQGVGREETPTQTHIPGGPRGLSEDSDGCRIASKGVDIALHPLQSQSLVIIPICECKSQRE